jgi:hypothetical protein
MGGALEHHSGVLQTQGLSQRGDQTTVWFDALHARGQKRLRLSTLAGELPKPPGFYIERWREILVACGRRGMAMEIGEA